MPVTDYLPPSDAGLAAWLGNFIAVAEDNLTTLHITTSDLNVVGLGTSVFTTQNAAVLAAKQAAKSATVGRRGARKTVAAEARLLVKRIQNTPDVPDTLKQRLGITVSSARRPEVPVFQPVGLVAKVALDLRIYLKWDKNGNHYGALYLIERKCGADTAWTTVKSQTATRFYDAGCPPGTNATYRVTATRGHLTSQPSMEVVVYPAQV